MKTIYALFCTLSLFFLVSKSSFAGVTACENNLSPVLLLSPTSGSAVNAQIAVPFTVSGTILDPNPGDVVTLTGQGLPPGATSLPILPHAGNNFAFTFTWTPSSSYGGMTVPIQFTATDLCGATATYVINVTVTCAPLVVNCQGDTTLTATANCSRVFFYVASATSATGISDFVGTPPSGSAFTVGTTTVLLMATDNCANTATCSFDITVEAPSPPTITCPSDISATVNSGTSCGAIVSYAVSASSPIGIANLTTNAPPGALFPIGKTTVTATATDACGSTSTCSFDVTVDPSPPPTITCPTPVEVTKVDCNTTLSLSFNVPATGAGVVVTYVPPSNSVFDIGTTTVTATATDVCGNTATCSFPVTVIGPEPPEIQCPANITVPASAGSCSAVVNYFLTVFDENEVDNDLVSNPPSGSTFPVGTTTVHASVTDECGNVDSCSFTVTVTNNLSVNAGPDASTVFGYPSTQTATNTAVASGGTPPYSYQWTLNRALKCNQVNSSGDELFTGGACTNNICPGSGSVTTAAPSCSGNATINATLLANATACVTVTDANGCTATECFEISAVDGRCFSGTSGKKKTKVCHRTGSTSNPWIQICVDKGALAAHLSHNPDDKVGPCPSGASRTAFTEEDESFLLYPNPVSSELTLDFGSEGIRAVQLYNTMGKLLFETTSDWEQLKMDMTGFAKGIYFISVRDEENNVTVKKFVKM